jgi:hypothetical protein
MVKPCYIRFFALALVMIPSLALLTDEWSVHGQVWICGKCKCRVGSGPNPPSRCPHCKTGLRRGFDWSGGPGCKRPPTVSPPAEKPQAELPVGILAVVTVGVAGIAAVTLKNAIRA